MSDYDYKILTMEDRTRLRVERVRALEAEVCRAELGLEDALSDAEREGIYVDIEIIRQRLTPHYVKLGLIEQSSRGGSEDGAPAPPGQLPAAE